MNWQQKKRRWLNKRKLVVGETDQKERGESCLRRGWRGEAKKGMRFKGRCRRLVLSRSQGGVAHARLTDAVRLTEHELSSPDRGAAQKLG